MKYPIPDAALDDRLGFVGTTGSGKTYNAGGCIERLLDKGARVVIVDPLDVWWGLRLVADGQNPSRYSMPIFGGAHGDLPLTENAGALIGETVAGMAESCIVSLGGLQTKASERRFMLAFLDAIYRKANGEPVHIIFDEADLWAPQKSSEPMLQSRMEEICRRGRVKGLIPWLITQRPAVVSKDVLSQVDGLVAFKLTSSQDRDALEGWIEGQADRAEWKVIRARLPTMERGQGVIWIPGRGILDTASFPLKRTFDSSRTPKRGEKQRRANLQPLDLGKLKERLATVEASVKADDPKALRAEIARLKADLASKPHASADPQTIETAARQAFGRGWDAAIVDANKYAHDMRVGVAAMLTNLENSAATIANGLRSLAHKEFTPSKPSASPAATPAPPQPFRAQRSAPAARIPSPAASGDGSLTNPQRTLLRSLAWWREMGHDTVSRAQLAVVCGWSPASSNVRDRLSEVSKLGLVEYPGTGLVSLTLAGTCAAPAPDTSETLIDSIREILTNPQRVLLDALLSMHQQQRAPVSRSELAEACNWSPDSSNIRDRLSELSRLELVEYPRTGMVQLQGWVLG